MHGAARTSPSAGAFFLRAIAREDHAQWLMLWDRYTASGDCANDPDIARITWARFFNAYEPMQCLVAECGGALVGFAHYVFHRSTHSIGPVCHLEDLFVREDARGIDVGHALIAGVTESARASGASRIYRQAFAADTARVSGCSAQDIILLRRDIGRPSRPATLP